MKKIVGEWNTNILLEGQEPDSICRLGQGEECCAFLVGGADGFECWRMNYPMNTVIFQRLEEGQMIAKGEGRWDGCPWKED